MEKIRGMKTSPRVSDCRLTKVSIGRRITCTAINMIIQKLAFQMWIVDEEITGAGERAWATQKTWLTYRLFLFTCFGNVAQFIYRMKLATNTCWSCYFVRFLSHLFFREFLQLTESLRNLLHHLNSRIVIFRFFFRCYRSIFIQMIDTHTHDSLSDLCCCFCHNSINGRLAKKTKTKNLNQKS